MNDLAQRLRDEAERMNEPFSPTLHASVMRQIGAQTPTRRFHVFSPWRYSAAAAVLLIMTGAVVLKTSSVTSSLPPVQVASGPAFETPLPEFRLPPSVAAPTYASLDHDARAFGRFISRQLNVLP